MRLLSKIIPCVGLVGVAATTTPFIVGCASSVPQYEYDIKKVILDPSSVNRIIKPLGEMKESDAIDIYFDDVSNNPQIIASDLLSIVNWTAILEPLQVTDYNVFNCKFRIGSINKLEHRLTYELVIHAEQLNVGQTKSESFDLSICLYNLQYSIKYNTDQEKKWAIVPSFLLATKIYDTLKEDTKWSIQVSYKRAGCTLNCNYDHNFDNFIFSKILEIVDEGYYACLNGNSLYFKNIQRS